MKYFLSDLASHWNLHLTREEHNQRDKEWQKACDDYGKYLQDNAHLFSKSFLNKYRNGGFHDYKIKKIDFDFANSGIKTSLNIIISLEHDGEMYFLISKDVTDFSSSIEIQSLYFVNDYLHGEYYKDDDGLWHHNFLFGEYNEIDITSKKFIFKKHTYY